MCRPVVLKGKRNKEEKARVNTDRWLGSGSESKANRNTPTMQTFFEAAMKPRLQLDGPRELGLGNMARGRAVARTGSMLSGDSVWSIAMSILVGMSVQGAASGEKLKQGQLNVPGHLSRLGLSGAGERQNTCSASPLRDGMANFQLCRCPFNSFVGDEVWFDDRV